MMLIGCGQQNQEEVAIGQLEEWDYETYGECCYNNPFDESHMEKNCLPNRKLYSDSYCDLNCGSLGNFTLDIKLIDYGTSIEAHYINISDGNCSYTCYGEFEGFVCK